MKTQMIIILITIQFFVGMKNKTKEDKHMWKNSKNKNEEKNNKNSQKNIDK